VDEANEGCQMKRYTCTICDEIFYSSAELERITEPFCPVCGGEIKEYKEDIHNDKN